MAKIEFYPLDFDYDNDGNVLIYGKTTGNERILVKDNSIKPYFYVMGDGNKASEIEKIRIKDDDRIYKVIKVYVSSHRDISHIRERLRSSEVAESDIKFIKRYLTENKIDPLVLSEANGEILEDADEGISIRGEVKQKDSEFLKNPRILAFDIEVYGDFSGHQKHKQDPIVMIAFKGEEFSKVITWKNVESKDAEVVKDEEDLIERFAEIVKDYKPDYITGYFTDGFDFPYIKLRAEEHGIKLDLGVDGSSVAIKKRS